MNPLFWIVLGSIAAVVLVAITFNLFIGKIVHAIQAASTSHGKFWGIGLVLCIATVLSSFKTGLVLTIIFAIIILVMGNKELGQDKERPMKINPVSSSRNIP